MKTTTKRLTMFVPAILADGGDERLNEGETFTDTQRTSPGGVVEAHHRERVDGQPGKSIRSNNPALLSAAVSDAGEIGVESKRMKTYRAMIKERAWKAMDLGTPEGDEIALRLYDRLRKVVDRHAAACAGGVKAK